MAKRRRAGRLARCLRACAARWRSEPNTGRLHRGTRQDRPHVLL